MWLSPRQYTYTSAVPWFAVHDIASCWWLCLGISWLSTLHKSIDYWLWIDKQNAKNILNHYTNLDSHLST